MIFSILGFVFTIFPLARMYLVPIHPPLHNLKGTFISIPKINAEAPIIENVNPWDENAYKEALRKGVAHARYTSLPNQTGTIFLFAHSSGMPWEITGYNTVFLRLGELKSKDSITIQKDSHTYNYTVRDTKEVWPNEVNYLLNEKKNQLILQTCTPIGTSLKRLLVFADPS